MHMPYDSVLLRYMRCIRERYFMIEHSDFTLREDERMCTERSQSRRAMFPVVLSKVEMGLGA